MVLKYIKAGKSYELASCLAAEAEGVFFSMVYPISQISSRIGGISLDADTEVYKRLIIIGSVVSIGVIGAGIHYLVHKKYRAPSDIAGDALERTVDLVGNAVNNVSDTKDVAVSGTGRIIDDIRRSVKDRAKDLIDKLR